MTENTLSICLQHQHLWLLPQKAVYWQERNLLLVADLHIGKSGHFRKHGIPVPGKVNTSNLTSITGLIQQTSPDHLIILGDLFHSKANKEWEQFKNWRDTHDKLEISLILGNHDILPGEFYHSSRIHVFSQLIIDPFLLVHDLHDLSANHNQINYVLSGHVHPAVTLRGKGRQTVSLPCFYFGKHSGILPAFGKFTGTYAVKPGPDDHVFAIAEGQVLKVS